MGAFPCLLYTSDVYKRQFQDIAMFVAYRLSPLESVLSTATHFILRKYKERGVNFSDGEDDERRITTL